MFFGYADDADLGMRARLLGWKAMYVPSAVVHHRHSAIFGVYSPLKVMLIERNRLLLAVKNFPLLLLIENPFWTIKRLAWIAYALLSRKGAASRFVETNGWRQTAFNLGWSYFSALKLLPYAIRKRRQIQKNKSLSNAETLEILRRFQIDIRELTLRD
jgi:GT2 family glycosyltransferase